MKKWRISRTSFGLYAETEDGKHEDRMGDQDHCLACAYARVLTTHGGDCDLRGLWHYGACYQMLAVIVQNLRDERYREYREIQQWRD